MSITLIIIIITALISVSAFNNHELMGKLLLWPARMDSPAEYHRLLTSGFIHSDWNHLLFNMLALFFFGRHVNAFFEITGHPTLYIWFYLSAIVFASLPSFFKHKNDYSYRALGASGGVSAILFSFVFFAPWQTIYVWFIPIPGIIFAIGYLVYSAYMSRKGMDNIGHDAHFYGAVYGFAFTWIFDPNKGQTFIQQVIHPHFNF